MKTCPMCRHEMDDSEVVCSECMVRIHVNESPRRASVLYGWGRALMAVLAGLLFFLGMWAILSPESYRDMSEGLGLKPLSETMFYLNAAVLLAVGILYGISWLAGYLERKWHRPLCLLTLIVFAVGKLIVQIRFDSAQDFTRGLALVFLWLAIPIFQYAAFVMGVPHKLAEDSHTEVTS
ncbi:hypothetical protein ACFL4W_04425 [Planctomycetota bacterium]